MPAINCFLGFPVKTAELETWLSVWPSVSYTRPHVMCIKVVFPGGVPLIFFSLGTCSRLDLPEMFTFRFDALGFLHLWVVGGGGSSLFSFLKPVGE